MSGDDFQRAAGALREHRFKKDLKIHLNKPPDSAGYNRGTNHASPTATSNPQNCSSVECQYNFI